MASLEYRPLWYSEVASVVCGLSSIPKVLFVEYQKCCLWYMALRWSLWYTEVAVVVCGLSGIPKWPSWYVASLVYRGAVCGIPEVPRVVDARRRRSSRDTRAMCGWGSGVHTRPKFEIGDVELLARKRELSSAPGTTNTRPPGGQTETHEFGVPLNPEYADLLLA